MNDILMNQHQFTFFNFCRWDCWVRMFGDKTSVLFTFIILGSIEMIFVKKDIRDTINNNNI